jgi:hypothetical protein
MDGEMTTFFTNEVLINFLIWGLGVTGASLIGILVWLGIGVLGNQKMAERKSEDQFRQFGQQLTAIKDLVLDDIHKHDVRITRLEEWRKTREGLKGDD